MTDSMRNKTKEEFLRGEDISEDILYFINPLPVRVPLLANTANVNYADGNLYVDFGFVDSYAVNIPDLPRTTDGSPIIEVTPVTRVALSPESALPLFQALGRTLSQLGILKPRTPDQPTPQEDSK